MKYKALSIVFPGGQLIAGGKKTIEVRSWKPDLVPMKDLLIIENGKYLYNEGDRDTNGRAVAIVDISKVEPWSEEQVTPACATFWEEGRFAWHLENIREIENHGPILAARGIYEVEL